MTPQDGAAIKPVSEPQAGEAPGALGTLDVLVLVVGLVIGVGIFRAPAIVAANSSGPGVFLALWALGGFISLVGALCYVELASAYPSRGGEFHFVQRAFGAGTGFVFAWSRLTVLQTGSIAMLTFVFADYAAPLVGVGPGMAPVLAAGAVIALTAVNLLGLRAGRSTQYVLTALLLAGLLAVIATIAQVGFQPATAAGGPVDGGGHVGVALVFVLLTYGGWSEVAYLSADARDRRGILAALVGGMVLITILYLLANLAYLSALGLTGLTRAPMAAATLMAAAVGPIGAVVVSIVVVVAALSSANAAMITGAWSSSALGAERPWLRFLAAAPHRREVPSNALLVQGAIALVLVLFGSLARSGFEAMVAYTAPVFWTLLLLCGLAVFRLRRRDPHAPRHFQVPFYPVTPALFCAASGYMLYSSLAHAGPGALLGAAVLAAAVPLHLIGRGARSRAPRVPSAAFHPGSRS